MRVLDMLRKHPRFPQDGKYDVPFSVRVYSPQSVDDSAEITVAVRWTWENDQFEEYTFAMQRNGTWGCR